MRKINYAVLAIILVFVWSCKVLDNESPTPVLSLITVDEARLWYERQSSSGARVATKKTEELAYWKYAQQGKLTNGVEIISVPLLYNNYHQVSVLSDENFVKQGDNYVLGNFDRAAYQIQRKLLISKDEKGNYRSVIITIIPDRKEQRKKEAVTRNKFSGTVLLMNKTDDGFEIGWRYKNGKFLDVFYPQPQSPNGRLGTYNCKVGFYKLMAVSGGGGGYNCTPGNDRACLPSSYLDQATGGFWVLTGTFDATCDDGLPAGTPVRKNPWDDESSWVAADPNGGGGGGTPVIRDPFDPISPTPIDYGMPIDLDPVDAFAWEMANRITNKIFLTGEEIELIRNSPWDLTYQIRNHVEYTGTKPVLIVQPDGEGLDFISLYGGLEQYIGPDPNICNECTEVTTPGRPLCAPRSAFPPGPWGDLLYKIDKAMAQSALFPGLGALRAPSAIYNAARFRSSLNAVRPMPGGIVDAHHILPQKFSQFFASKGINIHEPRFGVWWDAISHKQNAYAYNQAWEQFIQNHPNASLQEIIDFARQLMNQYGFNVFWL